MLKQMAFQPVGLMKMFFSCSSVCLWHIQHDSIAESIINDSIVNNAEKGTAVFSSVQLAVLLSSAAAKS